MSEPLSFGFSPCPNDTYIFHALVHGMVPGSHRFAPPHLEDVETLNGWAMEERLDVTKLSFHAMGLVSDSYMMLGSGAALGRGCGPLLVAAAPGRELSKTWRIAIPGQLTTATLLLRLFAPACDRLEVMRFDRIIPAVASGRVDGGLIIHESRFTYQQAGLHCVQDLGAWWEGQSGLPLPLGCIAAKRSLGEERIREIELAIRASLTWANDHYGACLPYIRHHAQELDDQVITSHIALYVNAYSKELGAEGHQAVAALFQRARSLGFMPAGGLWPWE